MISMSAIQDIRRLRREGDGIASISRTTGVSEPTARKCLKAQDMSPQMPLKAKRPRLMGEYAHVVDGWLEEDLGDWRKQRHAAKRIWQRLCKEHGADLSYSPAQRHVKRWKEGHRSSSGQFLDRAALPADLQVDFYLDDIRTRLHYLVCDSPFSNVGLAQVFFGETAECVCEGLMAIFYFIGGVPRRIIFDNATGVGCRVCKTIRTSGLFGRFACHFGLEYAFCNPNAGHEKGAVGNKVGALRRELFVPLPKIRNIKAYNEKLLARCMSLADKPHHIKGETERTLFCEDEFALSDLPADPFRAVTWQRMKADKYGNVVLDGRHRYSTSPEFGSSELIVGKGAFAIEIYDVRGNLITTHKRAWGDKPTESIGPASQLALLRRKPAGWPNSRARASLPSGLRAWMDGMDERIRKESLRIMRDVTAVSGYGPTAEAMEHVMEADAVPDRASVAVLASGICNGRGVVEYDKAIDMSAHDAAFSLAGGGVDA